MLPDGTAATNSFHGPNSPSPRRSTRSSGFVMPRSSMRAGCDVTETSKTPAEEPGGPSRECPNAGPGIADAEHRLHRAEPIAGPAPEGELPVPPQVRAREEVRIGIDQRSADSVLTDRLDRLVECVAIRHLADVYAAASGEIDVPPGPHIYFKDLEYGVPWVELELGAEDAAVTRVAQQPEDG